MRGEIAATRDGKILAGRTALWARLPWGVLVTREVAAAAPGELLRPQQVLHPQLRRVQVELVGSTSGTTRSRTGPSSRALHHTSSALTRSRPSDRASIRGTGVWTDNV
jgi:hypothetical protein